jgi:hypothetical protein
MNRVLFLGLLLAMFQQMSCSKDKNEYVTIVDYVDNTNRRRGPFTASQDSLYIFFEENFKQDTLELEVEKDSRIIYLDTSPIIGLADVQIFGNIQNIKEFQISLNGKPSSKIEIKDPSMNKWAVNFYGDTVWVTVLRYAPFYD